MAKKSTATNAAAQKTAHLQPEPVEAVEQYAASQFPIVGIGASAGGLEAFTDFLRALPDEPGMAFVFIQHQEPKHVSMLTQILARATKMAVTSIEGDVEVERNHLYVAPSGAHVKIADGHLQLLPGGRSTTMPIDAFFRSLAEDQGTRAVGVVLSGVASDGSVGVRAIKAEGGITFAQDDSAKFDGMPRSAVVSGAVDFILSPRQMAEELVRIARHSYITGTKRSAEHLPQAELKRVFSLLQASHDLDFTHYKPTTVERRIRRRMAVNKVDNLGDYLSILTGSPAEIDALYSDILIRVTGFFRDPEVFEALQRDIFPALMENRDGATALRIWVPGCATGEEVYSIAITALELSGTHGYGCPIQIFGTDVSDAAIDAARAGIYPDSIIADISQERLQHYFTRTESGIRVSKAVRDCCIFARQNLTKDPPFSKLDLVSCRNVMIYLGPPLQRKVMSIFHYALRPNGYLLLGSSETIGNYSDLFAVADRKHKIYRKKAGATPLTVDFEPASAAPRERPRRAPADEDASAAPANVFREADRVALARYVPAGVLINEKLDIIQFRGRTSPFLEPAPGTASFNLLKMAREGLLGELRAALLAARKSDSTVRRENVRIKRESGDALVNLEILPI